MNIAVISDIHDNLTNLDKIINWSKGHKVGKIICLGDITNTETINHLATNFAGEIFIVHGNCELFSSDVFSSADNLVDLGRGKNIIIDNIKIGCVHEPSGIAALLSDGPDFIFYGHTHKPWIEKRETAIIANPGNVAGVFHQATFAVLNTESRMLELKLLAEIH